MGIWFHNIIDGVYYPGLHDIQVIDTTPAGDTTPPAAPATPTPTVGNGQVALNWADSGESDFDHYAIYQGTASGGPYTLIADSTTSDYIATGLTNGTPYYFVIVAIDESGNESADSTQVSGTPATGTAPAAPTSLVATAEDAAVALEWDDNGEGDLDYYRVYQGTVTGGPYVLIASPTASAYTAIGLVNATEYFFVVTAVDTTNNESAVSNEDSDTPAGAAPDITAPATPTGLGATAEAGQVVLNWDDNGEGDLDRYGVYRSTSSGGSYSLIFSPTASTHTDTAVVAGTAYWYKVSALDTSDNESTLTAAVGPTTPTGIVVPPGGGDGQPTYANRAVTINPGDDIDTKIQSVSAGTIIGFAAGVHLIDTAAKQFSPRNGEVLVGETDTNGVPLAIIRGNWNQTQTGGGLASPFPWANSEAYTSNVKFLRLMVERFASAISQGALNGGPGWLWHKCWIHDNKSGGIRIGSGALMFGCKVYRNMQIGIICTHANTGATVDTCEVYENNYNDWNDWTWEGGAMKFIGSYPANMVVRRSHYHHNHGPGIWYDDCGAGGLIEDNLCEFNDGPGIFYEICDGPGLIRRNTTRYNGDAADLYISNSRGFAGQPIVVEDNVVYNRAAGGGHTESTYNTHASVWLTDATYRSPRLGYVTLRRNRVYRVSITGKVNLVMGQYATTEVAQPGVVINDNDYYTNITNAWQWRDAAKNWSQWQALGFDTIGSTQAYQAP